MFLNYMDILDNELKDNLKKQLISATELSEIKRIVLEMIESGEDVEKHVNTAVYRNLVLRKRDYKGFQEVKKLVHYNKFTPLISTKQGERQNNIKNSFDNELRIVNEEDQLAAVKKNWKVLRDILQPTIRVQEAAIDMNGKAIKYIDNPTFGIENSAVRQNGMAIKYIEDPHIEIQIEAVKQNPMAIKYIDKPTVGVQIAAVKKNWQAISFILEPATKVQEIAVDFSWKALGRIDNPSMEAMKKAIIKNGIAIQYIKNPTTEIQLLAVESNWYAIKFIDNPSKEIQLKAINKNPKAIIYIDKPDEDMIREAIKKDASIIRYLSNISLDLQIEAMRNSGLVIQFISNPSEDVQLEAVKTTPVAIQFIKNPSISVQLEAVRNSEYSIQFINNPSEIIQTESVKANPNSITFISSPSRNVLAEYNKHIEREENDILIEQFVQNNEDRSETILISANVAGSDMDTVRTRYDSVFDDMMIDEYHFNIIDNSLPIDEIINYLCDRIDVIDIFIASGYVYKSGLELIGPSLEKTKINSGVVKVIIGSLQNYKKIVEDINGTLRGMDKNTAIYINNLIHEQKIKISTFEERFYHGKFYLLRGEEKTCIILGSSNVSVSGFKSNSELNALQVFSNNNIILNEYLDWFNIFWSDCLEISSLKPDYFSNLEIEENFLIDYYKIEKKDKDYLESKIEELTDEEIKNRFINWLIKEPDNIYTDLDIESLKDYILIEYKDYNLIVLESFEAGNGYYYFKGYDVESLVEKIRPLSKTEIFNLSTMKKRGYHLSCEKKFKTTINSLFIKKYNEEE